MIHQQPFSMGAAYAGDGVRYWSWDGGADSKYGSVTLTDFGPTDHGFGGYIHEDGGVRRYDIDLLRVPGVSGHMLVQDGWVYVADTGNARVIRFKADSGTDDGPVKPAKYWREPYELGYNRWVGAIWQVVAGRGAADGAGDDLVAPSGLAMSPDGLRLFVSDASTQDVVAYSVDAPPDAAALDGVSGRFGANSPQLSSVQGFRMLGRIHTPASQIQGLAYDTVSARLFYVDAVANRLVVVNPDCPGSGHDVGEDGSRPAADAGTCSCPDDSAQAGCTAPMDPAEPSQRLYAKFVGANFDGCARQYFDRCPGGACQLMALQRTGKTHGCAAGSGDPTVPGHFALAPCYNLGLESCEAATGICRCPNGAEAVCVDTDTSGTCTCPADAPVGAGPPGPAGPAGAAGESSVLAAVPGWIALVAVLAFAAKGLATKDERGYSNSDKV